EEGGVPERTAGRRPARDGQPMSRAGLPLGRVPLDRGLVGPRERTSAWWQIDWVIAGSALLLSLLGSLLVWSATKPRLVVTVVDYRALRAYAPFVYIASCLGLVAVLLVGTTINGAHSWIVIGGGFQV